MGIGFNIVYRAAERIRKKDKALSAIDKHELITDVQSVAAKLRTTMLSRSEYFQHGNYTAYQVYDGGRTWEEICLAAGLKTKKIKHIPDEEYFKRLASAYILLKRCPKVSERKKYGLSFSKRRYATLNEFIRKAASLGYVPDIFKEKEKKEAKKEMGKIGKSNYSDRTGNKTKSRIIPPIPNDTRRRVWERIGIEAYPYAPHDELGVVALFAILCSQGIIKWQILELRGGKGIDITCWDDDKGTIIQVELKHTLSKGSWNHKIDDLDYVVCWENRWPDFPKPVIALSKLAR